MKTVGEVGMRMPERPLRISAAVLPAQNYTKQKRSGLLHHNDQLIIHNLHNLATTDHASVLAVGVAVIAVCAMTHQQRQHLRVPCHSQVQN